MIYLKYISYKDNQQYLISSNKNNYSLEVFQLLNHKNIISLHSHKNHLKTIRYFLSSKNFNEYLISSDESRIVIIHDITNNYIIKNKIDTKYNENIYSCLLIFPNSIDDNFIITSTISISYDIDKSATKIYSLNNSKFIKYIYYSNHYHIRYLLSWHNKKKNKYYIIENSI